jgi:hypothetical protein
MKTEQSWFKEWLTDWIHTWLAWSLLFPIGTIAGEYYFNGKAPSLGFILIVTVVTIGTGALGHGVAWLSKKRQQNG